MRWVQPHFRPLTRWLHWVMKPFIFVMLFIGVAMVASVSQAHSALVAIHKPLGAASLVLALVRAGVRLRRGSLPFPADMPRLQQLIAHLSHIVFYGSMVAMPLIAWSMLSATDHSVVLRGGSHLLPILQHDVRLHPLTRALHTCLTFAQFVRALMHLSAALFRCLLRRHSVLSSMDRGVPRR